MSNQKQKTKIFKRLGEQLPKNSRAAGFLHLSLTLGVDVPLRILVAVSNRHVYLPPRLVGKWQVFDKRYWPGDRLLDHFYFAFTHEDMDLLVLKMIFDAMGEKSVTEMVKGEITRNVSRLAWFYYEFLTGKSLDIPDLDQKGLNYIDALDKRKYFTSEPMRSRRHKVRDNLLGVQSFCPVIRRTEALERFDNIELDRSMRQLMESNSENPFFKQVIDDLEVEDALSSFAIEGERPSGKKLKQWCRTAKNAMQAPLARGMLKPMHEQLMGDREHIKMGIRDMEVFVLGRNDRYETIVKFVFAKHTDLERLLTGLFACHRRMADSGLNPVLNAAAIAFGFVYIHPLQDGNGRLHRHILNHVLAERGYMPKDVPLPFSMRIIKNFDMYKAALEGHSGPLMDFIKHARKGDGLEVLNETADLYSYLDATKEAELICFLAERLVHEDIPRQMQLLQNHEAALVSVKDYMDMRDMDANLLIKHVRQNMGRLPKNKRDEFAHLSDGQVVELEKRINAAYED